MNFKQAAHPYQREAVNLLINAPCQLLLLPVGFGKTAVALSAAEVLISRGHARRALVLSTRLICRDQWPEEARQWDDLTLSVGKALGTPGQRRAGIFSKHPLVTMNVENIAWLLDGGCFPPKPARMSMKMTRERSGKALKELGFDILILDESALFKSHTAGRVKSLIAARGAFSHIWALTGGFMPQNDLTELWPQYRILDGGQRLGESFPVYRRRVQSPPPPYKHEWVEIPGARNWVFGQIADITYRVDQADAGLDLPERVDVVHKLHMSAAETELYKRLEKECFAVVGDEEINAVNAAVLASKLQQLASGFAYTEDGGAVHIHDLKMEACQELSDSLGGQTKLAILYWYKESRRRLGMKDVKDAGVGEAWNLDTCSRMAMQPKSAGHGLNLQKGSLPVQVLWYEPTWSAEADTQAVGRFLRQGYKGGDRVVVHYFVVEGTIEERMLEMKQSRVDGQIAAMKAVQTMRENLK